MKQVKGAILKNWIKIIRSNKTGIYDEILTEEDKSFLNQTILDAVWYPYEYYKNYFNAVAKVEAKNDMENVIKWGYDYGKMTVENMYKDRNMKRGPRHALTSYLHLFKLWFDFGTYDGEIISDNEINVSIGDFDNDFDLYYYLASGWLQSFFEAYLDNKVTTKFLQKSWEGADKTIINVSWKS